MIFVKIILWRWWGIFCCECSWSSITYNVPSRTFFVRYILQGPKMLTKIKEAITQVYLSTWPVIELDRANISLKAVTQFHYISIKSVRVKGRKWKSWKIKWAITVECTHQNDWLWNLTEVICLWRLWHSFVKFR